MTTPLAVMAVGVKAPSTNGAVGPPSRLALNATGASPAWTTIEPVMSPLSVMSTALTDATSNTLARRRSWLPLKYTSTPCTRIEALAPDAQVGELRTVDASQEQVRDVGPHVERVVPVAAAFTVRPGEDLHHAE